MTLGSHNFVKFTVIKLNCQKHSGFVFAAGKNAMYPFRMLNIGKYLFITSVGTQYLNFSCIHGKNIFSTGYNISIFFFCVFNKKTQPTYSFYLQKFKTLMTSCHLYLPIMISKTILISKNLTFLKKFSIFFIQNNIQMF